MIYENLRIILYMTECNIEEKINNIYSNFNGTNSIYLDENINEDIILYGIIEELSILYNKNYKIFL